MGTIIPKPDWFDGDGSLTPMPGGIFDGLPQDSGSGLEMLLSPEDMAEIRSGSSEGGSMPGTGSAAPDPLDRVAKDIASGVSKLWNLPNTVIGLTYGGLGYLAGQVGHAMGLQDNAPGVSIGKNSVQFTDNPFIVPDAAITLGNAEVYGPREEWDGPNSMGRHEEQHTYQGEQLGPFYLPSNILGGIAGEVMDGGDWHGPHNWNEVGPKQHPPAPWPK